MPTSLAIIHQFSFWKYLGHVGGYFRQLEGASVLHPKSGLWPSKIFGLTKGFNAENMRSYIMQGLVPNAIALEEDGILETHLSAFNFEKTSTVKGMGLSLSAYQVVDVEDVQIEKVKDKKGLEVFSQIASDAFGYNISPKVLHGSLKEDRIQLFVAKNNGIYCCTGILYTDENKQSGIHMIGVPKKFRGQGLGKQMTMYLLNKASADQSEHVFLVASKLGALIYEKLGFREDGNLVSYRLKKSQ
ncbi:GNAT family N-acetyltransferase [Seonamhaeicola marinus]|uniref:GNAT family N-acetyltransferase n=1 Tax=Seonamhaeicola marinus TaxID=1912246 RepID=A0A5D0HIQ8_9FLAO|nr:GNAT family N-acetyltransferase [Seonamhaeicola marinus]TYA69937.1 GNAT family N-acetyltransferase [Seonamhaeicola marinus]